jgi:DNA-binding XRE family transcriptional regulator
MRTKQAPRGEVKRMKMDGNSVVVLTEADYERLLAKADEWEPILPEPDADGNFPAMEYSRVSLARKIIRDRRRLGLSQVELARLAGIRPESLNRIEQGRVSATIRTLMKIDRAMRRKEHGENRRQSKNS